MAKDYLQETIQTYNTIADSYASKLDDYAPRSEQEKFISLLPNRAKILDAGCGPGRDCEYFADRGLDVVGIDLSDKLLEIAKKRVPSVVFQKQNLRTLQFQANSFDGIWACASLLHLKREDVLSVLKQFYTILKPQGILFVMVKEGKGEADIFEVLSSNIKRHFTYFSLPELNDLLIRAEFKVMDIYLWNEEVRRPGRRDLVWISSFSRKPE